MSRLSVMIVLLVVDSLFVGNNEAVRVRSSAVRMGPNPGIVFRVAKSVLDKGTRGATRLIGQHAKSIPLPDVACTISGVDLDIKNVSLSQFEEPVLDLKFGAPNRVYGSLLLTKFGIEAPYKAIRRTFIKDQHDDGTILFNANNIKVTYDAKLGECETGMPKIDKFECTTDMGPAQVNVKNAKEKFAVEVIGLGAKLVRPTITTQVCAVAKRMVEDELNRYLAKIPNVLAFNENYALKYAVKPQFAEDYIQVGLFAKILTEVVNPEQPLPFTECPAPNAQILLLVSDAVVNEFIFHAFANNKLSYTITKNIHPLVHGALSLSCPDEKEGCLGKVLPHLAEKYGKDADVALTLKCDKAPKLRFVTGKGTFTISIHGDLAITPSKPGSATHHETMSVEATGSLQPKIHEQRLYGKATVEEVKITIDDERNKQYEQQVHDYCKKVSEEVINDVLFRGLPLKLPFGFGLTDPQICMRNGTFQANTGFDYQPQTNPPK